MALVGPLMDRNLMVWRVGEKEADIPWFMRKANRALFLGLTSFKGEMNSDTIIVGDFNTLLTPMDRSTKQKIGKETQTLNDTMGQLDLIDIYRTSHPKTMNFIFSQVYTGPSPG